MRKSKFMFFVITVVMVVVFIGGAILFFMDRKPRSNQNPEKDYYLPAESFDETTYAYQDELSYSEKNTETHIYTSNEKGEKQQDIIENKGTSVIIGGADGPTSIYLAPKTYSDNKMLQDKSDMNDQEYTTVIDRVLNKYDFEPVAWNNTIDWKEDADILVKMAEDAKGRYRAYGIVSKEKGSYGIVLIDTVDSTEIYTNYVYEKWFYTGSSNGEPEFKWNENSLFFKYPVPSGSEYIVKTVEIDCGYDSGHMEFRKEE